ncbi:MAG: hypothetical protein QOJ13_47 [Gaiellales bacterium]|jgi:hypothetical protein|nr:hypothetical protein [Gaiellales bacterium]
MTEWLTEDCLVSLVKQRLRQLIDGDPAAKRFAVLSREASAWNPGLADS